MPAACGRKFENLSLPFPLLEKCIADRVPVYRVFLHGIVLTCSNNAKVRPCHPHPDQTRERHREAGKNRAFRSLPPEIFHTKHVYISIYIGI